MLLVVVVGLGGGFGMYGADWQASVEFVVVESWMSKVRYIARRDGLTFQGMCFVRNGPPPSYPFALNCEEGCRAFLAGDY